VVLKGFPRSAVAALFTASVALFAVLSHVARWNPAQSYDTRAYYYPPFHSAMARIFSPGDFVASLLTPADVTRPSADRAKPVFVALSEAWSLAFGGSYRSFVAFEIFTYLLASLAFLWLGARLGWLGPAFWSWAVVFLNPWTLFVLFFNSYTALSLALMFLVFGLMLGRRQHPFWAGIASFLLVFTSQSATVLCAGLFGALVVLGMRDRRELGALGKYVTGGLVAWGVAEGLVLVTNVATGAGYGLFFEVLTRYLARSGTERSEYFAAYDEPVLLLIFWFCARAALGLVASSAFLMWSRRRQAWSEPWFPLMVAVVIAKVLIDLRVGPKFPRTYVLLFPLAMLAATGLYHEYAKRKPAFRWILGAALAVALLENAAGLAGLERAALAVREVLDSHAASGQTVYVEEPDTFNAILGASYYEDEVRPFEVASVCEALVGSAAVRFLSSPNLSSPLNLPGRASGHAELALGRALRTGDAARGECDGFAWEARAAAIVPHLALYPILALEDPREAYRYVIEKRFDNDAYLHGLGTATLWEVRRL
jgi:hypothetical protein